MRFLRGTCKKTAHHIPKPIFMSCPFLVDSFSSNLPVSTLRPRCIRAPLLQDCFIRRSCRVDPIWHSGHWMSLIKVQRTIRNRKLRTWTVPLRTVRRWWTVWGQKPDWSCKIQHLLTVRQVLLSCLTGGYIGCNCIGVLAISLVGMNKKKSLGEPSLHELQGRDSEPGVLVNCVGRIRMPWHGASGWRQIHTRPPS